MSSNNKNVILFDLVGKLVLVSSSEGKRSTTGWYPGGRKRFSVSVKGTSTELMHEPASFDPLNDGLTAG